VNKRQRKKEQKKQMLYAFHQVIGECWAADDPLATLQEIKTRGEQHFKELGLDVPPAGFDEIMTGCEQIIKELRTCQ
jgi:hypothetical protein